MKLRWIILLVSCMAFSSFVHAMTLDMDENKHGEPSLEAIEQQLFETPDKKPQNCIDRQGLQKYFAEHKEPIAQLGLQRFVWRLLRETSALHNDRLLAVVLQELSTPKFLDELFVLDRTDICLQECARTMAKNFDEKCFTVLIKTRGNNDGCKYIPLALAFMYDIWMPKWQDAEKRQAAKAFANFVLKLVNDNTVKTDQHFKDFLILWGKGYVYGGSDNKKQLMLLLLDFDTQNNIFSDARTYKICVSEIKKAIMLPTVPDEDQLSRIQEVEKLLDTHVLGMDDDIVV